MTSSNTSQHNTPTYLNVSGPFLSLVGHPLLDAGQFLLQISHLVRVELCQVVQLVFQSLIPGSQCKRSQKNQLESIIYEQNWTYHIWITSADLRILICFYFLD